MQVLVEGLPGHQHVARVVLDQQHVDHSGLVVGHDHVFLRRDGQGEPDGGAGPGGRHEARSGRRGTRRSSSPAPGRCRFPGSCPGRAAVGRSRTPCPRTRVRSRCHCRPPRSASPNRLCVACTRTTGGTSGRRNFSPLPSRLIMSWRSSAASPDTTGSSPSSMVPSTSARAGSSWAAAAARDRAQVDRLEALGGPADPGEREQVVDQLLHALGAVHREPDVLVGALVELARRSGAATAGRSWTPCAAAPAGRGWPRRRTAPGRGWTAPGRGPARPAAGWPAAPRPGRAGCAAASRRRRRRAPRSPADRRPARRGARCRTPRRGPGRPAGTPVAARRGAARCRWPPRTRPAPRR